MGGGSGGRSEGEGVVGEREREEVRCGRKVKKRVRVRGLT